MAPLTEGYRYRVVPSSYGGVAQRWVLIYSEPRQPQAQRTVDKQWLKQSDREVKAFQTLCRTAFACEADAQEALAHFAHDVQRRFSLTVPSPPRPIMGSGGAPALAPSPTRSSTISPAPWRHGLRTTRHALTSTAVLSSRRTNWMRASYPPRPCSMDTKGKPGRNAGFAFLKTRNFWPLALSQKTRAHHGPVDGDDGVFTVMRPSNTASARS